MRLSHPQTKSVVTVNNEAASKLIALGYQTVEVVEEPNPDIVEAVEAKLDNLVEQALNSEPEEKPAKPAPKAPRKRAPRKSA